MVRHLRAGLGAGIVVFAVWGLLEPLVPLTRRAGVTFLPFLSAGPQLFAYEAVSMTVYALVGAVVGAALGLAGGALASGPGDPGAREGAAAPPDAATAARPPRVPPVGGTYALLLAWAVLSFGVVYFLNRMVPGSYLSSRGMRLSATGLAGTTVAAAVAFALLATASRNTPTRQRLARAGRRLQGVFAVLVAAGFLTTAVLAARELTAGEGGPHGKPNVILISIDALRADHLSAYGYQRPTSPEIDRLAGQGVLFENAYCQAPSSTPSHASMLTGLYPFVHGAVRNGDVVPDDVTTVAERFRAAGYRTGGFLTNPWLSRQFGFAQGFETYVESGILQQAEHASFSQFAANLFLVQAWGKVTNKDLSFTRALRWIRSNRDRTFFLFLHLLDPHGPYTPPDENLELFLPLGADKVTATIAAYDGEIRTADGKIGQLVATLKELGLWDETVICLTADHGENMNEHDVPFAHGTLYESSIHVPLIIVAPGRVPAGRRVPELVESIDIVPTLARLARLPLESGAGGTEDAGAAGGSAAMSVPLEGIDLGPYLRGGTEPAVDGSEADGGAAPGGIGSRAVYCMRATQYAVRHGEWKFMWGEENEPELYHLPTDPNELHNLADEELETAQTLFERLHGWEGEMRALARAPVSGIDELDPATVERLKALGYLK